MNSTNYTAKKCGGSVRGCGEIKPLREFPEKKNSKTGRGAVCFECIEKEQSEREKYQRTAQALRLAQRKCKSCGSYKDLNFYQPYGTGRRRVCIECAPTEALPESKKCLSCSKTFPLSEFTKNSNSKDGRASKCLDCRREDNRATAARRSARSEAEIKADRERLMPTGRKTCPKCKKEYALENFGRNKYTADGCGVWCYSCLRAKNAKSSNSNIQRSDDEVEKDRTRLRPDGVKKCRHCGLKKQFVEYASSKRSTDGLSQICKECSGGYRSCYDSIVSELKRMYGERCMFPNCDETDHLTVDHVLPVSLGGFSELDNYQLLCGPHNSRKGNKHIDYRNGSI